jgi:hypothetical protein
MSSDGLEMPSHILQGSFLKSTSNVSSMTAEWPLAAAFYVYQNGL